jgi:membrane-associated phospholipid phosphatase
MHRPIAPRAVLARAVRRSAPLAAGAAVCLAIPSATSLEGVDVALGNALRAAGPATAESVTVLGAVDTAILVGVAAGALLLVLGHVRAAVALAPALPLSQGVVDLLKGAIERPRPEANAWLAEAAGWSAPSGHSATAMVLWATLALALARWCRPPLARGVLVAAAALVVAAVGLSRVALGAHYPSDVLAGWLVGAVLVVVCWELSGLVGRRTTRASAAR